MLTGNIRTSDRITVLTSFKDTLKRKAEAVKRKHSEWTVKTEEILFQKLQDIYSGDQPLAHSKIFQKFDHSEPGPTVDFTNEDRAMIYHLVGYLVLKGKKLICCEECLRLLERPLDHFGFVPEDGNLTDLLDNDSSLRHPAMEFYNLFLFQVEPKVTKMLTAGDFYGDVLTRVIESLGMLAGVKLGCDEKGHLEAILLKMIPYYITLRFQFYSRCVMRDGHGVLTKNRRKEAKLISK